MADRSRNVPDPIALKEALRIPVDAARAKPAKGKR
jgi:hypothetical protein